MQPSHDQVSRDRAHKLLTSCNILLAAAAAASGARAMSTRHGPPKHQNRYAWKPNAGRKINETEVGGRFRPLSEITGVCGRCKGQIEWKRRYGKYKPLSEPAKCQLCSKRNVRQAYHNLCTGCAKEQNVCAKCRCQVQSIGRDSSELEVEQKMLEEAIKNARERDRRTLLRAMNKGKSSNSGKKSTEKISKVGELFPTSSLDDYAKSRRTGGESHDNDEENEEEEEELREEEEDEGNDADHGEGEEEADGSEEDSD